MNNIIEDKSRIASSENGFEQFNKNNVETAVIQLKGKPYQREVDGETIDGNITANNLVKDTNYRLEIHDRVSRCF